MNNKNEIVIYSLDYCPFCQKAKFFFDEHNLQYKEICCEDDEDNFRKELTDKFNLPYLATFPQIVINGTHIGGYSDLISKFENNEIDFK